MNPAVVTITAIVPDTIAAITRNAANCLHFTKCGPLCLISGNGDDAR